MSLLLETNLFTLEERDERRRRTFEELRATPASSPRCPLVLIDPEHRCNFTTSRPLCLGGVIGAGPVWDILIELGRANGGIRDQITVGYRADVRQYLIVNEVEHDDELGGQFRQREGNLTPYDAFTGYGRDVFVVLGVRLAQRSDIVCREAARRIAPRTNYSSKWLDRYPVTRGLPAARGRVHSKLNLP